MVDYYEFLQISPNADTDTIHRVYRFLATRLHPDNPESGDPEKFYLLKTAYDVLSNSERRAEYDASRREEPAQSEPLSSSIDFMDTLDGELNRRLAVLAVLYFKRRTNPNMPEVALAEIEQRMGFPRDYLDFTTWYLVKKGYITRADNAEFTLTAEGVDFVETQRGQIPVLNKMLTTGSIVAEASVDPITGRPHRVPAAPIVLPSRLEHAAEQRTYGADRLLTSEVGVETLDRRESQSSRRVGKRGRRATD
jgi:curved DNA-binding protein